MSECGKYCPVALRAPHRYYAIKIKYLIENTCVARLLLTLMIKVNNRICPVDNASYIALSRQITLRRELDISANNIANMNTTGYKFEQLLVNAQPGAPAYNDSIRTPATFAYDNGVGRDFGQGALTQTGNVYDMAIAGDGAFFVLNGAAGDVYTRNGAFTVSPQGTLVSQAGLEVQGEGGATITLDPRRGEPVVSNTGIVSQFENGQTMVVGKLNIVRPANLSDMRKNGEGNYYLTGTLGTVPATDVKVEQGMLESSNVNSIVEVTKLIEINRAYARLASLIDQAHQLNRTAIQQLGKVA